MNQKNPMMSTLSKVAFYGMSAVLFLWTAALTMDFVGYALPNLSIARYFALVVFDGGVIIWLFIYLNHAEGIGQRTTSFVMIFFDLLGLLLITTAELALGGQLISTGTQDLMNAALWGLGIWTFINVAAVVIFHLTDVETMKQIVSKTAQDKITAKSLQKLHARTDEIADEVAAQLAEEMVGRTLIALEAGQQYQSKKLPVQDHLPLQSKDRTGRVDEAVLVPLAEPETSTLNGIKPTS